MSSDGLYMQAEATPQTPGQSQTGAPARLFNKNYLLLWQGQFVSKIGSQLYMMAINLWITANTESPTILGIVGAISAAVAVVLGPFTGTFADRYSRKRIIVWTDMLNGLVISSFAAVTFLRPNDVGLIVVLLAVVAMVSTALNSFFGPAIEAAVPDLVPRDKLAAANSMGQLSTQVSSVGAIAISGLLFSFWGAPILFLFNGLSYIFSGCSQMFITIPQAVVKKAGTKKEQMADFKKNIAEGFQYIWQKRGLKHIVALYALLSFFSQPVLLLMSFFVQNYLGLGANWERWYGYLGAAYGIGTFLGFSLSNILRARGKNRAVLLILFTLLEAMSFVVFGLIRHAPHALGLAIIAGMMSGFVMVNIMVILQASTPSEIRGRLFGVLGTLTGILTPISLAFSGIIAELVHKNIPVIYCFCGIAMLVAALIMTSFKDYRHFISAD